MFLVERHVVYNNVFPVNIIVYELRVTFTTHTAFIQFICHQVLEVHLIVSLHIAYDCYVNSPLQIICVMTVLACPLFACNSYVENIEYRLTNN